MTEAGASETATVKMLLSGYAHALQRLQDAIGYTDAVGTFRAVFESLNWASCIDDRIGEHWAPEGQPLSWKWRERVAGAELMAGVRFARNRVHHQWVDAIYFNEAGGLTFPVTFPLLFSTYRWRALSELPRGNDDRGSQVYVEHLEHQPLEKTLLHLGRAFEWVGQLLEPTTTPTGRGSDYLARLELSNGIAESPSSTPPHIQP
jgi:hypothetical protein